MSEQLIRFLEQGYLSKSDRLQALFDIERTERSIASQIFSPQEPTVNQGYCRIPLDAMRQPDVVSQQIQLYLQTAAHPAIVAAIVHGSVATKEIIAYSDYDAVLVIEPGNIASAEALFRLRKIIRETNELMRRQDALQHHGWQVILVPQFNEYPDDRFPIIALQSGAVLYPQSSYTLAFKFSLAKQNYKQSFYSLADSIEKKISTGSHLTSFYAFKNLISECLLLPAVYIQAKTNVGVEKKDSFQLIRETYTYIDWQFMDAVSELRSKWTQPEATPEAEAKAARYKGLPILEKTYRTRLPERYKDWFTAERQSALSALLNHLRQDILITVPPPKK